jgi:toxin YxiD
MNDYIAEMKAMFQSGNIFITSYHIKAIQDKEAYKKIVESEEVKNDDELFVDILKGAGMGIYDAGKDFVTKLYDFVTNPWRRLRVLSMQ